MKMPQKNNKKTYGYQPQEGVCEGYQPSQERGYKPDKSNDNFKPIPPNKGTKLQPDKKK
jgi:hypothetical protein